jgi:hypothetical protein
MKIQDNYLLFIFIILSIFIGCKTLYGLEAKDVFLDKDQLRFIDLIKKSKYTESDEMIKNGIDINFKNEKGVTPIYYFYLKKDFKSFNKMLELGADPNVSPQGLGMYYLLNATMLIKEDRFFKLLLEYNVDINYAPQTVNGRRTEASVLEFSLKYDIDVKYLKMLIEHKIKPYYSEHPAHSPILWALSTRDYKKIIILLEYYPAYLTDDKSIITTTGDRITIKDRFIHDLENNAQMSGSQYLREQQELVKYLKDKFNIDVHLQYPNGR